VVGIVRAGQAVPHLPDQVALLVRVLEERTYTARRARFLADGDHPSPISLIAVSQEMRWYFPFTSFIGYFSRANARSCRARVSTAALGAVRSEVEGRVEHRFLPHPHAVLHHAVDGAADRAVRATCVFTSILPALSAAAASALPIMFDGNCEANAPAPAATPER